MIDCQEFTLETEMARYPSNLDDFLSQAKRASLTNIGQPGLENDTDRSYQNRIPSNEHQQNQSQNFQNTISYPPNQHPRQNRPPPTKHQHSFAPNTPQRFPYNPTSSPDFQFRHPNSQGDSYFSPKPRYGSSQPRPPVAQTRQPLPHRPPTPSHFRNHTPDTQHSHLQLSSGNLSIQNQYDTRPPNPENNDKFSVMKPPPNVPPAGMPGHMLHPQNPSLENHDVWNPNVPTEQLAYYSQQNFRDDQSSFPAQFNNNSSFNHGQLQQAFFHSESKSSSGSANTYKQGPTTHIPYQPVTNRQTPNLLHSRDGVNKATSASDHQRSADQKWLDDWLKSLNKRNKHPAKTTIVTINNYKCCLQEALKLQKELEIIMSTLNEAKQSEEWNTQMEKITMLKGRLESLNEILSDEATLENIKILLVKRKTKRWMASIRHFIYDVLWPLLLADRKTFQHLFTLIYPFEQITERLKRQKLDLYKEKQCEFERRNQLHQEIDKIQDKLLQKSLQEKQDKELKLAVDGIMGEVRRKLSETDKTIELITGLKKLRQLRCQSVYSKGMYLGMESESQFDEETNTLLNKLLQQKKVYETEQKTLQVMLEIEQEENKEKEREKARILKEERARKEQRLMNERMFGKEEKWSSDDALYPFRQYYHQAEFSTEALVTVRQSWDRFLVPEFTPDSSTIPDSWVPPTEPSSDAWADRLK